jgi:hypothetical protein
LRRGWDAERAVFAPVSPANKSHVRES